jgi:hypothetical protein
VRGFENPEDVWVVLVVEGIEDIPLPLEVTRIAELLDAEALRTGEVFEVDTADRRDVTTLTRRNVGGFGKRGLVSIQASKHASFEDVTTTPSVAPAKSSVVIRPRFWYTPAGIARRLRSWSMVASVRISRG